MKYAMFAAAAAATLAIPAASTSAQGLYVRATSAPDWCVTHRDGCVDNRDVRRDRYDVHRDDRAIALQQERIRGEERAIQLDRMNRESVIRNERVNSSYGQRVAQREYQYIFGRREW